MRPSQRLRPPPPGCASFVMSSKRRFRCSRASLDRPDRNRWTMFIMTRCRSWCRLRPTGYLAFRYRRWRLGGHTACDIRRSVTDLSSSPGPWVRHRTRRSGPLASLRGAGSPIDRQSSIRWLVPDRRAGVRAGELRAAGVDGEGAALGGVDRGLGPARTTPSPEPVPASVPASVAPSARIRRASMVKSPSALRRAPRPGRRPRLAPGRCGRRRRLAGTPAAARLRPCGRHRRPGGSELRRPARHERPGPVPALVSGRTLAS